MVAPTSPPNHAHGDGVRAMARTLQLNQIPVLEGRLAGPPAAIALEIYRSSAILPGHLPLGRYELPLVSSMPTSGCPLSTLKNTHLAFVLISNFHSYGVHSRRSAVSKFACILYKYSPRAPSSCVRAALQQRGCGVPPTQPRFLCGLHLRK